ncbi:nuclear transport factor 2 family protein [Allorhizobium sp. NPDC080224]|uniref:nuclear transport factor 2 family protein n=1 Tax=Allorhizobium sp. NPDC080224 TaxID=3390547 RepID=UPI003CFCE26C
MSNTVTGPLEAYFEGRNARDLARALSGFSETAVVHDESRIHRGRAEIGAWMQDTINAYDDRSRLLSIESEGDDLLATAEVSGNFPGSPISLRCRFQMTDGLISSLEIAP